MKLIPLSKGKSAMVDDSDFDAISAFKWFAHTDGTNWYAERRVGDKHQKMHIFLMQPPNGVDIDHKDRNGLNNQRNNFRICLHSQNCRNRRHSKNNKSGYKGVSWKKKNKRWCAQINIRGKVTHLGLFTDPIQAALAYDKAATEFHGEFASTNEHLGLINPAP